MQDAYDKCDDYDRDSYDDLICNGHYGECDLVRYYEQNFKDFIKVKVLRKRMSLANKESRRTLENSLLRYEPLYSFAIMNLIIQIFGIIFWACGRFLDMVLGGGSDEKTPSEGEAAK